MNTTFRRPLFPNYVTCGCLGRRVKFGGEFGNQLFQVAAVLGYAERHGNVPVFSSWRCAFSGRSYEGHFPRLTYGVDSLLRHRYEQPDFRYRPIPRRRNVELHGMFQSERYFPKDPQIVRDAFAEPPQLREHVEEFLRRRQLRRFSAVHLRYYDRPEIDTGQPVIATLPDHYFAAAIDRLPRDEPLLLVSNNPAKAARLAREHAGGRRTVIAHHEDALVDFYLLARARNFVMSNSTFSWWAAYLNPGAAVYAPKKSKWFAFPARLDPYWDTRDLYPGRFQEIDL